LSSLYAILEKKSDDKVRKARTYMTINKLDFIFREQGFNNIDELSLYLKPLVV